MAFNFFDLLKSPSNNGGKTKLSFKELKQKYFKIPDDFENFNPNAPICRQGWVPMEDGSDLLQQDDDNNSQDEEESSEDIDEEQYYQEDESEEEKKEV